ncbi:MAG: methylated-DNA--[protein]-cysteine S-methyltransferase [Deltaproteobacteria bacterium]|jgi:methylated-DNA-[protein]-cysteine S-methyltransferase|nr:methylated-DNA--[protein]-cysteine S-methyltransferase [Deltaproteobacteria bacterium]
MFDSADYESPFGKMLLACRGGALTGVWFVGQKHFPEDAANYLERSSPVLVKTKKWLDEYFLGRDPDPSLLPLAPEGGEFRRLVWSLIKKIPYGRVASYGDLAREAAETLGRTAMSARAVGQAVGRNPLSVVVPCHRVVGSDGGLTGYAGKLDVKRGLLELEGVDPGLLEKIGPAALNARKKKAA